MKGILITMVDLVKLTQYKCTYFLLPKLDRQWAHPTYYISCSMDNQKKGHNIFTIVEVYHWSK